MPRKNSAKKHNNKEETQKLSEEQRRLDRISPEKYMEKGELHIAYHGRKEKVSPDSVCSTNSPMKAAFARVPEPWKPTWKTAKSQNDSRQTSACRPSWRKTMSRNSSKSKKQRRKACKPAAPENSSLPPEARERIPDNYVRMWLGR